MLLLRHKDRRHPISSRSSRDRFSTSYLPDEVEKTAFDKISFNRVEPDSGEAVGKIGVVGLARDANPYIVAIGKGDLAEKMVKAAKESNVQVIKNDVITSYSIHYTKLYEDVLLGYTA